VVPIGRHPVAAVKSAKEWIALEPQQPRGVRAWVPLFSALVLGIAVVAGTLITTQSLNYIKTFNTSLLTVTGQAQMNVTSDQVKWTANYFVNTAPDALQTGYAQMATDQAAVQSFLQGQGIATSEITIAPVTMSQIYVDCAQNPAACGKFNIAGYRLEQTVTVQSSDVQGITRVAQNVTPLIGQGVSFSTQSMEYYYTKLADIRAKLLAQATGEAQQRAQQIAAATGRQVGQLVSVQTQPLQLTPVNSAQVSNSGQYDTTTIEKQLTAIVQAQFRLPQ
jgi:hypothetical protein